MRFARAERQLDEYFHGDRISFDVPLDLVGTDFQKKVWAAMLAIPFGETRTYGEIARQIGKPEAVRAVGGAANRNPIAVLAPCHRIVGASGDLTGFAGGLKAKTHLLALESGISGVHPLTPPKPPGEATGRRAQRAVPFDFSKWIDGSACRTISKTS